ncbi:hypothetical protein BN1708_005207 [Verticillium longisporum]|uniref:RNA-binding domain-containing protein n=1 Tax=Verticillium longisporum TaxID=100787 RepID=A0A0G4M8F6_VERLO|nr:hypothetical protein BN1708_005207 [Verticillium longisporum]
MMQDLSGAGQQAGHAPSGRFPGHVSKPSNSDTGFSHGAFTSNISGFADRHPRRGNIPTINTQTMPPQQQFQQQQQHVPNTAADMATPGTAFDMQFTPLLPSQLLLGSPFQPGTPGAFGSPQFQMQGFQQAQQHHQHQQHQNGLASPVLQNMSPQQYQAMVSPSTYGAPQYFAPQSPTASGFGGMQQMQLQQPTSPVSMTPGIVTGTSRTTLGTEDPVYLSVDIDVLDPAFAPGTGTPEPGGWTTRELIRVLRGVEGLNVVGADVVEVSPAYQGAGEETALAAAQVVYEVLSSMVKKGLGEMGRESEVQGDAVEEDLKDEL